MHHFTPARLKNQARRKKKKKEKKKEGSPYDKSWLRGGLYFVQCKDYNLIKKKL